MVTRFKAKCSTLPMIPLCSCTNQINHCNGSSKHQLALFVNVLMSLTNNFFPYTNSVVGVDCKSVPVIDIAEISLILR